MTDYWRIRRFLGLTQLDVSLATGVAVQRISLGERGFVTFNYAEQGRIENYLQRKLIQFQGWYEQPESERMDIVHA